MPWPTPSDFTATIAWGDGHSSTGTVAYDAVHKSFTVAGSNTYAQAGSYGLTVSIQDLGGASAIATASANIADAPLSAAGLSVNATEGAAFSGVLATFTDPNALATPSDFTATITWGDGHSSTGTVAYDNTLGAFTVAGAHTYAQAGSYGLTVSIQDLGGASAIATASANIADAPLSAAGLSVNATEGAAFSGVLASFTDPNALATPSSFTTSITWGDGHSSSGTVQYDAAQQTFAVSGAYLCPDRLLPPDRVDLWSRRHRGACDHNLDRGRCFVDRQRPQYHRGPGFSIHGRGGDLDRRQPRRRTLELRRQDLLG